MATPGQNSNPELLKAINALTKSVENIGKSLHTSASGNSGPGRPRASAPGANRDRQNKRSADHDYDRYKKITKNQERHFVDLTAELVTFNKHVLKMNQDVKQNHAEYRKAIESQHLHTKALLENGKMSKAFQEKFVDKMNDLIKSSKTFDKVKFKSTSTSGRIKETIDLQDQLTNVISTVRGAKNRRGVNTLGELKSGDIRSIVKSMNDAGLSVEGMSNTEFLDKLQRKNHRIAKKTQALRTAKKIGAPASRINSLTNDLAILKGGKSQLINAALGKSVSDIDALNNAISKNTVKHMVFSKSVEAAENVIKKFGGEGFSLVSALGVFVKTIGDYTDYIRTLASRQIGGWHNEIAFSALRMGVSAEAATKYLMDFGHQVSQFGKDSVTSLYTDNKAAIEQLGLFGNEALAFASKANKNFEALGLTAKNPAAFNAGMKTYIAGINKMAKLTGLTADQLVDLDRSLISSNESTSTMLRLDATQRKMKMDELLAERNRLVMSGMTADAAQRLIETFQSLQNRRPTDRITDSMKLMQTAQMMGMGADASKLASLSQKRLDQMTGEEKAYFMETMKELSLRVEKTKGSNDIATEEIGHIISDMMGNYQQAMRQSAEGKLAEQNRGKIDPNSEIAKDVENGKQLNSILTSLWSWTSGIENAFTNPIVKAIAGLTMAAGLILVSLKSKAVVAGASKLFEKGYGALTGIRGAAGAASATAAAGSVAGASSALGAGAAGAAGKAGIMAGAKGVGKSVLKKLPLIGLLAGVGFGVNRLMDGDFLGAGGEILSGAASTIPGIGTAASIGIDTALAARDAGIIGEPKGDEASKINVGSTVAQSPAEVHAENAKESKKAASLEDILASINNGTITEQSKMDEMIELLKQLIEAVKPDSNGLLDAIKNKGSSSFEVLQDKRSLLSTR